MSVALVIGITTISGIVASALSFLAGYRLGRERGQADHAVTVQKMAQIIESLAGAALDAEIGGDHRNGEQH